MEHAVIIGASHAGSQLAASLRQRGWEGRISILGSEFTEPYHRPPLSKAYLAGEQTSYDLSIRTPSFYAKSEIDLLLGITATAIDRKDKAVVLDKGWSIPYTRLALATGAEVRKLDVPGRSLAGVFYLRNIRHVDAIRHYVQPGRSAVIIGGGYVGLETAASLRKLGMQVTVVEALPRVLQRVTAPEVSEFYSRVHAEEGVEILTDVQVERLEGTSEVEQVLLKDGTRLLADLVVIGVGVVPATGLAEAAGLEVDNGIMVDQYARTSDPDIVACGDCSNHYNPIYGRRLRLESVQNATDQAKVAANTICGRLEPYRALPWFWSDQFDLKLQIAGLSQGHNRVIVRGSSDTGRSFAAFYFDEDRLLAVDAINRPREFMLARKAIAACRSADPQILADDKADVRLAFS